MEQRLLEDWRLYCSAFKSPQTFIDMSFYSLISAALQRRVWLTSPEMPLFGNQYVIMVGPPGVGKGLVLTPYKDILTNLKLRKEQQNQKPVTEEISDKELLEEVKKMKDEIGQMQKKKKQEPPLLIPLSANAITYQALVEDNANSVGSMRVEVCKMAPTGIYTHNSLSFVLEELESLFYKDADRLVNYLGEAWDCKKNYEYKTKHGGADVVRSPCLNMLAGTNPGFLEQCYRNRLISGGLSSRMLFIVENKPRFNMFSLPPFTEEQLEAKQRVSNRVEHLGRTMFGQVNWTIEAWEFLKDYFENNPEKKRINKDRALDYYYERKNIHVQKLALAIHFADSNSMELSVEEAKESLKTLERLEPKMHQAVDIPEEDNIIGKLSRKMLVYVDGTDLSKRELFKAIKGHERFEDALSYLINTNQLEEKRVPIDGREITVYRKVR